MKGPKIQERDLHEYDSPFRRIDGTVPYNSYLWPTESWWLGHEHPHYPSRWTFGYVALMDGRFCVSGLTWHIRDDNEYGRKNNFPTRTAAIRAAAARLIHVLRAARKWEHSWDRLEGKRLAFAINWTLATVARETKGKPHRIVHVKEPAPRVQTPAIQLPLSHDDLLEDLIEAALTANP